MRRPSPSVLLGLIVALGAILRFARLYWGLGDGLAFFDEQVVWSLRLAAFRSLRWSSFDATVVGYPTLYGYVGGLAAWLVSWLDCPVFSSLAAMVACLRTMSAIAGVVTLVVVARVGTAMYGRWVGIAAAAFLAVAPLEAMQTHYASVDPLLNLCGALVLAASWRIVESGTMRKAVLAGAAVGLATATKYTGLAFATTLAWALGEHAVRAGMARRALVLGVVAALGFAGAFALACPPCVMRPAAVFDILGSAQRIAELGQARNNCVAPSVGWWGRPWLQQLVAVLPYGLGLPLALSALGGLVVAAVRRTPGDRLLLATLLPYFAYMGSYVTAFPRYTLPLFPGLAILAAAGLARVARPFVATLVAVLVVAYGAALTGSQIARFSWDQQTVVAEWLGRRATLLHRGERLVGIPGTFRIDPYFRLREPITANGYTVLVQMPGHWLEDRPTFFVMPEWEAIAVRRDRRDPALTDTLDRLESGAAGYRPVFRVPIPPYLQRPIDERLDPAFAIDLWQGAIGFTVYARDDVVARLASAVEPPAPPATPRDHPSPAPPPTT